MVSRIVHLSDLHLGDDGDASWRTFEALRQALQTEQRLSSIAGLIVSGDLGDHPDESKLRRVKAELSALAQSCGLKDLDQQLIVIPGNHDYRTYGLIWQRPDVFNKVFKEWTKPRYLPINGGRHVAVFCFDSNTSKRNINLARGLVGKDELNRFKEQYAKCEREWDGFGKAFKIAVVHHHPLPIASAEVEEFHDAFLVLEDAGTFLRELAHSHHGIDLVLHGHKHYPAFGRIKIPTTDYGEREITVLSAGSACKHERQPAENSFNVITLDNSTVLAERWSCGTGLFARDRERFDVLSYEAVRQRAFDAFRRDPSVKGVRMARELHTYDITRYGDCLRRTYYEDLSVEEAHEPLESMPLVKKSTVGRFADIKVLQSSGNTRLSFQADADSNRNHRKGKLVFDPPIAPHPHDDHGARQKFSFALEFLIFNGFAMNLEQAERMYGLTRDFGDSRSESVGLVVKYPTDELEIRVKFPETMEVPEMHVEVIQIETAGPGPEPDTASARRQHNDREQKEACKHLSVVEHTAILKVPKPLANHRYGLSWPLLSDDAHSSQRLLGAAVNIRDALLALHTTPLDENVLQPMLRSARQIIYDEYSSPGDALTDYEVAVWVFDTRHRVLRCVAGAVNAAYLTEDYTLLEGEGITGRAHKHNTAIYYVHRDLVPGEDPLTPPPKPCKIPQTLLVLPLRYPAEDKSGIVGLLSLSILSKACKLLEKATGPDFAGLTKYLYTECYEKGILQCYRNGTLRPNPSHQTVNY